MSRRRRLKQSSPDNIRLRREGVGKWAWWFGGYRSQQACAWYITREARGRYRVESKALANGPVLCETLAEVRTTIAGHYTYF